MEQLIILLVIGFVVLVLILPIFAAVRASRAKAQAAEACRQLAEVARRLKTVEEEIRSLKKYALGALEPAELPPEEAAAPAPSPATAAPEALPRMPFARPPQAAPAAEAAASAPPALPPSAEPVPPGLPPPIPEPVGAQEARTPPVRPAKPLITWEHFMGVKLAGWLAGLALFLGAAFYIKYAFDNNLISPPIRVASGFLVGLGLLVAGLRIPRERYAVGVQVLSSAGILILYADVFASSSFYHFVSGGVAFALMALVTAAAFLLAVRLNAQAVAILALLGGFLTPPLLSTGENRPVALFMYLALLDFGLIAVALRKRWNYLALLGALATVMMQYGWVGKFFSADQVGVAMAIYLGYAVLFALALGLAHKREQVEKFLSAATIMMAGSVLVFAFYLLVHPYPEIAARPWLLFGFVFLADMVLLALAGLRAELRPLHLAAGGVAFFLLIYWTMEFLTPQLLNPALALYLVFAILHSVYPVVIERLRPGAAPVWWANLFTPLALLLAMVPIFKLDELSFLLWPVILLMDVLAILLAVLTCSLLAILGVLVLTLLAVAFWIGQVPAAVTGLPEMLFLIGGFAVFFFAAGVFVASKLFGARAGEESGAAGALPAAAAPGFLKLSPDLARSLVPALSALLPFLLLALVLLRLPLTDPSAVFGLAALLIVLLLGVVRFYHSDWALAAGLGGLALVEAAWQFRRFTPASAVVTLVFYVVFYALLTGFPFVFARHTRDRLVPWAVATLAGPAQFYFVYTLVMAAFRNPYMGLVPAAFAVPSLLALVRLLKVLPAEAPRRNTQLACFAGVALFFITLIFPIQFEKQWITVGWALEGAALLWLLHRVPHEGLKSVGVVLLATAFVRLTLNPAVLHYHARTGTPIFNWYLYAYGLAAACLFAGARLLAPPRNLLRKINVPPILQGLGTALAFLLLNLEIADYFSTGTTLTFEFSGNLARDMTYSLAWGLFALVLLVVGLKRRQRAPRYAGLGLLVVTMIKLFLHDIWQLGGLYRIGSLIGLALVMLAVSFLYQRFLSDSAIEKQDQPHTPP